MRKSSAVVAAGFVVACGAVLKPPAPDRRLNIQQNGSMFESNNGYRFAVLPQPGANVIRLDVRYPIGAADDPKGKEGLAHLVEHMLFDVEYTRGASKTSISAELGRNAIAWNAETHPDYTSYQTVFARTALDDIIAIEVNRLAIGCGGLTPEIFAREREVVMNELRQRQGGSGAQFVRVLFEAVYPVGHPYRAVGSVETVKNIELKDVCDFIGTKYQQGKAFIIVSGDVNEDIVQRAVSKQFLRLRKRDLAERRKPPVVEAQPGTVRLRADLDDPALLIATWPLPPRGTRDYRMLEAAWIGIPRWLELWAFVWKFGHSSFAEVIGGAHAPVLAIGLTLNSLDKAGEAKEFIEKSLRSGLESVGQDSDDPRWQSRWQGRIESLLARYESLGARNDMFGDFMMFDDNQGFLVGHASELKESSPDHVRDLARKWLSTGRARYLLFEASGTLPVSSVATYSGGGAEAHATEVNGALADEPLPPPPARSRILTERYTLGNGLEIVLWPYGSTPVVRGRLVVDSGAAHDPPKKEGVSLLVGADDVQPDSIEFQGRELAIVVDELVLSIGLELRSPGLPLDDEQKDFVKARLRNKRTFERNLFEQRMLIEVYGDSHPYARPSISPESVDRIHHDVVRDWARSHIVAKNSTLIITGQFDPELVKKHIAYNLDQVSSGSDSKDIDASLPSAIPRYVEGTDTRPSPTVELDAYFVTVGGIDKDYAKRLVLQELLDAELSKLRNKQALTYGFYSAYSPRKSGGLWMISGRADATRSAEAANALLGVLAAMRKDPETYRGSFVLARQKVMEKLLISATDSYSVGEELAYIARFDLDENFFTRLPAQVAALTLSELHPFMLKELPPSRMVFGAFGNVAPSKAAVAAAKQLAGQ